MKLVKHIDYNVGDPIYRIYINKDDGSISCIEKMVITSINVQNKIPSNIIFGLRNYEDRDKEYELYCNTPNYDDFVNVFNGTNILDPFNIVNYYIFAHSKKELRYILWMHPLKQILKNIKSFFKFTFKRYE